MNGSTAKIIRRAVYGTDFSPRHREYRKDENGTVVNAGKRKEYQEFKKNYKKIFYQEG